MYYFEIWVFQACYFVWIIVDSGQILCWLKGDNVTKWGPNSFGRFGTSGIFVQISFCLLCSVIDEVSVVFIQIT